MAAGNREQQRPQSAVKKRIREPLGIGALLLIVLLIIVLASTSNEIAEIAYVVETTDNRSWHQSAQKDLVRSRQASDFAVGMAGLEVWITEKIFGSEHLGVAAYSSNLASLYISRNELSKSEELLKRTLSIRKNRLSMQHPFVAQTLSQLAFVQAQQKKYDEAIKNLEQCASIQAALPGLHKDRWTTLANAGYVLLAANKKQEAEEMMRQSLSDVEQKHAKDSLERAFALHNLANVLLTQSKFAEAKVLVESSQPILESSLGLNDDTVLSSLAVLAYIKESLGENAQAEKQLRRLVDLRKKANGTDSLSVAMDLASLGRVLMKEDQLEKARSAFEESMSIAAKMPEASSVELQAKIAVLQQYKTFLKATNDPKLSQIEDKLAQLSRKK